MAKRGPKLTEIDQVQFEKLCGIQCTQLEIACWFLCSDDTIDRWCKRTYGKKFAEVFNEKRKRGAISLRRMQWQTAEKGNVAMQIWLGKQYLGQSDKIVSEVENKYQTGDNFRDEAS